MSDAQNNDGAAKPQRVIGRPFAPGQSGNPGGRRAMSDEDRAALDDLTPKAWKRLGEILAGGDDNVAMKAVREIFDRRFGRAPAAVEDQDAQAAAFDAFIANLRLGEQPK